MHTALLGLFTHLALASMPSPGVYLNSEGSPLIPLLESASQSIDIEIYTMNDPEVHGLILDALSRGVKVRILKDPNPYEDKCNIFLDSSAQATPDDITAKCVQQRQFVADVRAAGGTFAPFNKQTLCPNGNDSNFGTCYEHGKIAVADGQVALISTGNFDDTNLCIASENPSRCNRDYSVIETDPTIVRTLEDIFAADLLGNSYDVKSLIPASLNGILTVSPFSLQPILDFINSAKVSIDIETQYLEDQEMNLALQNAATRGVHVNVTVASLCAFGAPDKLSAERATGIYSAFDRAGISTAMFNASNTINGVPGYMHAKVIVVDGERAWVGSANGSSTSLTENREYGIIFNTPSWVQDVLDVVQADHNSPNSETWNESLSCTKDEKASDSGDLSPPPSQPTHRKKKHAI